MSEGEEATAKQFSEVQGSKKNFFQMVLVQSLWEKHILCFSFLFRSLAHQLHQLHMQATKTRLVQCNDYFMHCAKGL